MPNRRDAFTLIELLVVITIIALLMALLLPALGQAKEAGRNVRCMSGERQLALATLAYMNDYGYFPACYIPAKGEAKAIGQPDPNYIFDREDEYGRISQVVGRWPALLMPYVRTTDAFRCSVEFINIPVNTYVANNVFWGATNRGQCIPDAPFLPDPSQVDNIAQPDSVVMFHESTRDWSGSLSNWISGNDLKWWGEYRGNFHYVTTNRNAWRFSGGRHFQTPSSVGRDPWGKQNIAMIDGHVRTNVSMQWLVDNERPGVFHSYPFRLGNEWFDLSSGSFNFSYELLQHLPREVGMEFWMVPWW